MDSEPSVATITNSSYDVPERKTKSAFHASWEAADAALLQPSNLAIPKAPRAWDRKPLKPFSTQRLRVGKVWKRLVASQRNMSDDPGEEVKITKRRKARNSFSGSLKPVKKMCLASDFGLGARVLQWDPAESPARKIVTRSTTTVEEMLALPDEEDVEAEEAEGGVTVEIIDEDGTVLDVGGEELAEGRDWEDEVDANGGGQLEASDTTIVHLADLAMSGEKADTVLPDTSANTVLQDSTFDPSVDTPSASRAQDEEANAARDGSSRHPQVPSSREAAPLPTVFGQTQTQDVLPDGFVSPMKRSQPFGKRSARRSLGSRRRTLPVQFASVVGSDDMSALNNATALETQQVMSQVAIVETEATPVEANTNDALHIDAEQDAILDIVDTDDTRDIRIEQEWEDVEDDLVVPQPFDVGQDTQQESYNGVDIASEPKTVSTVEYIVEQAEHQQQPEADIDMEAQVPVVQQVELRTEVKLPSSPVPQIEGQHPRLPLRRSPRRKSSSPLKQSTILPSTEKPHLVAFTPLKGPPRYPSPSNHPGLRNPFLNEVEALLEPVSPPERAVSAPPEEPQMSPQKPSRPRVSDDTALLQAFLNRAAESKSSRRISATKRESITNRRDSDAVRQALASPAKADVLGDLDPNSPSPRKPSGTIGNGGMFDGIEIGFAARQEQLFDDIKSGPATRRGDRAARRTQPMTPVAPNKIAIRGNADNFLLKRSEAQELATLTRNNTRKNKGGAVLPPIRLTKLTSQTSGLGGDAEDEGEPSKVENATGSRNVRWAETLVELFQYGEISEVSVLSDELNAPVHPEQVSKADSETSAALPPPSETPSKPKIRRLKAPRTAATPGKPPAVPSASETERLGNSETGSKAPTKPTPSTRRRSRIATPAKGLTNASLLPSISDAEPVTRVSAAEKKIAPRKKATVSKLPAPSTAPTSLSTSLGSSTTSTSASSSLGQGKENLISSPPKKRTVPTAKTFAPKLDFGSKSQLQAASTVGMEGDVVPGLMSPAKKARGRGIVFGSVAGPDFGAEKSDDVPGLNSPAKKRTRRAGGV